MERRQFLKIAGLAGLAVIAPIGLREGAATPTKYPGPFFLMVNAGGGWDPTIHCDPKGGAMDDRSTPNMSYTPKEIGKVGQFSFAPTTLTVSGVDVMSAPKFFQKNHGRLMVLN